MDGCVPAYPCWAAFILNVKSHPESEARDIADKLIASLGSILLYWYQYSHNGKRIEVESDEETIGGHFLHLLHGKRPSESHIEAMHVSLILYAEHEFNASTFTARVIAGTGSDMYSCITGAIGALKGPKHGGANEVAYDIQKRYRNADEAEADIRERIGRKEIVIGLVIRCTPFPTLATLSLKKWHAV